LEGCRLFGLLARLILFSRYFQSGCGTTERVLSAGAIDIWVLAFQPLQGALPGFFCPADVDFFSPLRRLCQDAHPIRQHFRETPGRRKTARSSVSPIADLADSQFSNQRRMAGKYAEISILSRNLHLFDLLPNDQSFRSDDFEFEGVH